MCGNDAVPPEMRRDVGQKQRALTSSLHFATEPKPSSPVLGGRVCVDFVKEPFWLVQWIRAGPSPATKEH